MTALDLLTHVAVILHAREAKKCATTGPFALTALYNSSLHLYGERGQPLSLTSLHDEGRRVLVLYPGERATALTPELLKGDELPITLVLPDGNVRQTGRAVRRIPGLEGVTQVRLPDDGQLDSFSALARALGIIEGPGVESELLRKFAASQKRKRHASTMQSVPAESLSVQSDAVESEPAVPLSILFEDDALIAINKPSGMLVHRGWARDGVPALQILRDQVGHYVFPVHRIDRATSGVLLFARTPEMARKLKVSFDEHLVTKRYLAVCRGHEITTLRVNHGLAQEKGKPANHAVTDFKLLGSFERYGLIEAVPLTGRTHQIRRHLKHISHPIIGDVRYGKGEHNRLIRERFGFHRLALHCESLEFPHPRGGHAVRVHAPLSDDFSSLLEQMGLKRRAV